MSSSQFMIFVLLETDNNENKVKEVFFGLDITKDISTELQYLIIKLSRKSSRNVLFVVCDL